MTRALELAAEFFKKATPYLIKNKEKIILTVIILLGAYLRLNDFSDLLRFNADQVRDAKIIDAVFEGESLPLFGPKAGGTTFKLGPAFYYLQYFSALIFGATPSGMAVFVPLLSILSIWLFYVFLKRFFSVNASLTLVFLYSVSFYCVKYSRFAWNPNIVPFFLLVFLIAILNFSEKNGKERWFWTVVLGLAMGIGVQLHGILLVLFPTVFALVFAREYFLRKKAVVFNFIFIILAAVFLNTPFLIFNLQNEGKNFKAFLEGTSQKTDQEDFWNKGSSRTANFFLQGSLYVLSGYEPQKSWAETKKLFTSRKNIPQAFLAFTSFLFFAAGSWLFYERARKEEDEKKKNFLFVAFAAISVSFLLFWILSEELNLRFFNMIFFIPFIFLGLMFSRLEKLSGKKLKKTIVAILAFFLAFLTLYNLSVWKKAYSLQEGIRESIYGGISLGEAREMSDFMLSFSQKNPVRGKNLLLDSFEFNPALKYLNKKNGFEAEIFYGKDFPKNSILFSPGKSKNRKRIIDEKKDYCVLIGSKNLGRFSIFAFLIR